VAISTKHKKQAFYIQETIERVLNDPFLLSRMDFGPGVYDYNNYEFWHGDVWKTSPLLERNPLVVCSLYLLITEEFIYYCYGDAT